MEHVYHTFFQTQIYLTSNNTVDFVHLYFQHSKLTDKIHTGERQQRKPFPCGGTPRRKEHSDSEPDNR